MEVGFTAGVSVNEHSLVASYFARFMLMRPYIVRPTTITQVLPATFKGLLEAVAKATATQVVIVAHGYSDGSGLFLPLVMGKAHTTMHYDLDKLMTIAKRVPPVATDAEALSLDLTKGQIQDLVDLKNVLENKKPPINVIEFRGCYLGKNYLSLSRFRQFFGANKIGAPKIGGFFGNFPHSHAAGILTSHTTSHVGTTYTYPESYSSPAGKSFCCIGVDGNKDPQNGHLVADTQSALDRWVFHKFLPGMAASPGNIPVHFLFDKSPPLPPGVPALATSPTPEPYFPLSDEYAKQIVYSP